MRKEDIRSLVGLSRISEETLQKITRTDSTLHDYIGLKSHIASLVTVLSEGRGVGASDDELLSYLQKKMTYSLRDYGRMICICCVWVQDKQLACEASEVLEVLSLFDGQAHSVCCYHMLKNLVTVIISCSVYFQIIEVG